MSEFNRHDIPVAVKELLDVAVQTRVYDVAEVFASAITFGNDWKSLTEDITACAFACRHSHGDANKLVSQAAEKVWQMLNV